MKHNHFNTSARLAGMIVALAMAAGIGGLQAQESGSAKGGATKLLQLGGSLVTPKAEPGDYKPMSCGMCTDEVALNRDTDAKGGARALLTGLPITKRVTRHGCDGCKTEWNVVGHGKAKVSVAAHQCTSCGAETMACCNTSHSGQVATKGMEKKFEVAPLK